MWPPRQTAGVVILLALTPLLTAADKPVIHLVRAKVTAIGEKGKGGLVPGTLEVVHVFSGPADLLGKSFTDYQFSDRGPDGSLYPRSAAPQKLARAPFEKDEEGLWKLQEVTRDGKTSLAPLLVSRKLDDTEFAAAITWAEAVESVAKAKPNERSVILRRYVDDPASNLGRWALTAIGELDGKEAVGYMNELADKPTAIRSETLQVVLDEVLAKRKGADWLESEQRGEMLWAWVKGKSAAGGGLVRIEMAHQSQELTDKMAVELTLCAADNRKWLRADRRNAMGILGRIVKRSANDDVRTTAYEWVIDKVRNGDDLEGRRDAAECLTAFFPLFPARLKAVEEHLATEKDEKVATFLRAAVKRAKAEK